MGIGEDSAEGPVEKDSARSAGKRSPWGFLLRSGPVFLLLYLEYQWSRLIEYGSNV